MKAILYNDDDNQFCVIFPNYNECSNEQEKEILLQKIIEKDLPKKSDGSQRPYFIKEYSELENRRYVKPAWKLNDQTGETYFDNTTAKEIKKKQFRYLRKPLLEQLDVEFMRALENGDSNLLNEIAARKKVLRDITKIDMSQYDTPEKLHVFIPDELK